MKKLLLPLFALFLSYPALAGLFTPSGTKAAEHACGRIPSDEDKDECFDLAHSSWFDKNAVNVCDRYEDSDLTLECMQIIANKPFNSHGLDACNRYSDLSDTNDCLRVIAGKYLQNNAIEACNEIEGDEQTTGCLKAIAGKEFSHRDVQECKDLDRSPGTIRCFRERGSYSGRQASAQVTPLHQLANFDDNSGHAQEKLPPANPDVINPDDHKAPNADATAI